MLLKILCPLWLPQSLLPSCGWTLPMFPRGSRETHQRISGLKANTELVKLFSVRAADGGAVAFQTGDVKYQGKLPVARWSVIQRAIHCLRFVIEHYRAFFQCKSQQVLTYYYNSNSSTANILLSTSENHSKLTEEKKDSLHASTSRSCN